MIRRLRERHRWMVLLVALLTALLFGRALAGRRIGAPTAEVPEHRPVLRDVPR